MCGIVVLVGWLYLGKTRKSTLPLQEPFLACPYTPDIYGTTATASGQPARAVIVPHHLLAHEQIHDALAGIAPTFDTVVILGPNHRNAGLGHIQTSVMPWKTPFGTLVTDTAIVSRIGAAFPYATDEGALAHEHSVCGLVGFMGRLTPKTNVVPVILKANTTPAESRKLADILVHECRSCLIVASVDFTHDSPYPVAAENDAKSARILEAIDAGHIGDIVADSPPVLLTLMEYLKKRGITEGSLVFRSDSWSIAHTATDSVTSYISVVYR